MRNQVQGITVVSEAHYGVASGDSSATGRSIGATVDSAVELTVLLVNDVESLGSKCPADNRIDES